MAKDEIRVVGARQHNLKNITVAIPRNRFVVVTGPSGSGKSSFAFDTLFAEGQRRYVESLSVYARQFLDQLEKPDVDHIEGLSPSIAIEQRSSGANPRSIIATTTEIYDYLRLLYAHAGRMHDPDTGVPVVQRSVEDIASEILQLPEQSRMQLLGPVAEGVPGDFRDAFERLGREGYVRVRVDGQVQELVSGKPIRLDARAAHTIEVVVDRLVVTPSVRMRLNDSLETALKLGGGRVKVLVQSPGQGNAGEWRELEYSTARFSPGSGRVFEPVTAQHFSFNSPRGACPECLGLGQRLVMDPAQVAPDPERTLREGAIEPYAKLAGKKMEAYYAGLVEAVCRRYGVPMETKWGETSDEFRRKLLHGTGTDVVEFGGGRGEKDASAARPFEGVIPNLEALWRDSESDAIRQKLKTYMTPRRCEACGGRRLRPEVLAVTLPQGAGDEDTSEGQRSGRRVPGVSIADFCGMPIDRADEYLARLELDAMQRRVVGDVVAEIRARLGFLREVGLGYLTLDRESGSLSGGEAQRIRLATQIGSGLVGVLYILDEPSIGLHARDNERLLGILERLRDMGNSLVVVEHDEETIRRADHVVDFGPGAGLEGGEVVAQGSVQELMGSKRSTTGRYLAGKLEIPVPRERVPAGRGWIEVLGARENNLKDVDVRIPLGTLTCVTGVSGSGKSTLVDDILRRAACRELNGSQDEPGAFREVRGLGALEKCVVIDQTPIGRTPRSNPATFSGMFNEIRELFASLPSAKVRGYGAGRFSFNVAGGRCERCEGDGVLKIEMHFLPPVYVTCESCQGRRYNRETLEIRYKGLSIAEVLELRVAEAAVFFRAIPRLRETCDMLAEVGMGYLKLGQPATTLSGGEAQRLKLAAELGRRQNGRVLYLLDEPTTGLHFHDVAMLLGVLKKLRDGGNTLVVVEHNLDVIKVADWVIDLGPEGGRGGGRVVASGPPEAVAGVAESHTGRFLRRILGLGQAV